MNKEEFKIGHVISDRIVAEIHDGYFTDTNGMSTLFRDAKPTKLTEYWLTRFGFNCKYKSIHNHWNLGSFGIEQVPDEDDYGNSIPQLEEFTYGFMCVPELKYVHQLQDLYLEKMGVELQLSST